MAMIFVTNKNDFHHTDRFNGEEYHFPPGEKVAVSEEAAAHMFGRGYVDKTNALQRLGWAFDIDEKTRAVTNQKDGEVKLARFVFTEAMMVERPQAKSLPDAGLEIA